MIVLSLCLVVTGQGAAVLVYFHSVLRLCREPNIYGINLGGWLLLERFLNPSLLVHPGDGRVRDEFTYMQFRGNDPAAVQALRNHWDTWLTEEIVANLSRIGFTHARIPIGKRL